MAANQAILESSNCHQRPRRCAICFVGRRLYIGRCGTSCASLGQSESLRVAPVLYLYLCHCACCNCLKLYATLTHCPEASLVTAFESMIRQLQRLQTARPSMPTCCTKVFVGQKDCGVCFEKLIPSDIATVDGGQKLGRKVHNDNVYPTGAQLGCKLQLSLRGDNVPCVAGVRRGSACHQGSS